MAYIGQRPVIGRYIKLDQISSGFNGSNTGFSMTAGSQAVFPGTARNLLLSLGGVIQEPDTDFTISGSTLTFTTAPVANTTFFGVIYGDMQATGTPSDGTVLPASIASSGNFSFPQLTVTSSASLLGGAVFNENGADVDFRVEGDTNTHLLFVDASADKVGIGVSNPANTLEISGTFQSAVAANTGSYTQAFNITNAINADFNVHLKTGSTTIGPGTTTPLCFHIGGTANEKMRIDSSGNVGIGTTSPDRLLHVRSTGDALLRITSGDGSAAYIELGDSSNGDAGKIVYDNGDNLTFTTTNPSDNTTVEKLRIQGDGKVGIGTTSPQSILHVDGGNVTNSVEIHGTGSHELYSYHDSGGVGWATASGGSFGELLYLDQGGSTVRLYSGGVERFRVSETEAVVNETGASVDFRVEGDTDTFNFLVDASTDRVGIGTNTPQAKLEIKGTNDGGNFTALHLRNAGGDGSDVTINMISSTDQTNTAARSFIRSERVGSAPELAFGIANIERMRLTGSSLSFAGTKNGNAYEDATLIFNIVDSNGNSKKAQILSNKVSDIHSTLEFGTTVSNSFGERMRIHSDGNLLIGTTVSEDTTGNSGPKIITTGDITIDGDRKALVFRSSASSAHQMSGVQWWNEIGAGVQCAIHGIREAVSHAPGALAFYTSSNVDTTANNGEGDITEAMRIDSNQRILLGTTVSEDTTGNSGTKVISGGDITIDGDQKAFLFRSTAATAQIQSGVQWWNENGAGVMAKIHCIREAISKAPGALAFYTSDDVDTSANNSEGDIEERMRIASSGKVGIGTSSPDGSHRTTIQEGTSGHGVLVLDRTSNIDSTFRSFVSIRRNGTVVGNIKVNNSETQYNTTSDYRLKENVVTMSNAIDRLKQLQPKRFNFILNPDITVDGFLAHEVQSVVPGAISGTKDEVDSDDNPVYQGIDQSKLVPLLTAALQEAISKIETLETKVAALEAA